MVLWLQGATVPQHQHERAEQYKSIKGLWGAGVIGYQATGCQGTGVPKCQGADMPQHWFGYHRAEEKGL